MQLRASAALAKHEFRVMATDVETPMFLIAMPLLMMAFLKPLFAAALQSEGRFAGSNGSEQAVPGMALMFSAFFVGYVGFNFLRDHGWGTWERLRASPATSLDIMLGKVGPPFAVSILQLVVLFAAGSLLFDLKVRGSLLALTLLGLSISICLISFGVAITAMVRTSQQLNALGSAGGMIFATFGGALVPLVTMPGWARTVAPATPTYWGMRGFNDVILGGGGLGEVLLPMGMLLLFTAAFTFIAATRFRFEETKVYFG